MIILSSSGISKSYGTDVVLNDISFHVNENDKIGIIGPNGAGKTTLLSILAGELPYDGGNFYLSAKENLGYLKQKNNLFSKNTVYEEVLSNFSHMIEMENRLKEISFLIAKDHSSEQKLLLEEYDNLSHEFQNIGGYSYKSEIKAMLNRMSFPEEDQDKMISQLSGGERTRLALASLLLRKPSILLLDEPTNHLDADTLGWLEQYLSGYKGTLLIVSHDRYFLDKTVNTIFQLENEGLTIYKGNYSQYVEKKREEEEQSIKAYKHQSKEIARQEDLVRRLAQHKTEKLAKRAKSVQKRLDKMDRPSKPTIARKKMSLNFKEKYESGNDVLFIDDLSMTFSKSKDADKLFENLKLHIRKGEKVCLVGANGTGKTTLLNIIMKKLSPSSGSFRMGQNVLTAYYDQQQALLRKDHSVLEEVHDDYRLYTESELRGFLGRFHFHGDDVYKKVDDLSGGERAKLALLKLMLSGANFLIMDEPTNHLDIASKEIFEDSILNFPGTALIVSHDRYLLSKVPDKIVELRQDSLKEYYGKYNYYLEKRQETDPMPTYQEKSTSLTKEARAQARKEAKEEEARARRLTREIEKAESDIYKLESQVSQIEAELCKEEVFTNIELSYQYSEELERAKAKLDEVYTHWLKLKE